MIALFLLSILSVNCLSNFKASSDTITFITLYENYISIAVDKNADGYYCVGYNHCGRDVKY